MLSPCSPVVFVYTALCCKICIYFSSSRCQTVYKNKMANLFNFYSNSLEKCSSCTALAQSWCKDLYGMRLVLHFDVSYNGFTTNKPMLSAP